MRLPLVNAGDNFPPELPYKVAVIKPPLLQSSGSDAGHHCVVYDNSAQQIATSSYHLRE